MKVTVWIESTYETGHECSTTVVVDAPQFEPTDQDALNEFFEEHVFPETGCTCQPYRGSSSCGSVYEARVTDADNTDLIGTTYEWSD